MTILDQRLPAVLRRRAKEFEQAIALEGFVSIVEALRRAEPLRKAAAELEERDDVATNPERLALDALADNRRLRKALSDIHNAMQAATAAALRPGPRDFQDMASRCRNALNAVNAPGEGITIMGIEVAAGVDRASLEHRFAVTMDLMFPADGNQNEIGPASEMRPPGRSDLAEVYAMAERDDPAPHGD